MGNKIPPFLRKRIQYRDILNQYLIETGNRSPDKEHYVSIQLSKYARDYELRPRPIPGHYWWGWWYWGRDGYLSLYKEGYSQCIYAIKLNEIKSVYDLVYWQYVLYLRQWMTAEIFYNGCMALNDIFEDTEFFNKAIKQSGLYGRYE